MILKFINWNVQNFEILIKILVSKKLEFFVGEVCVPRIYSATEMTKTNYLLYIYIIKQISHNESESGCVRVKTIVSLLNQRRYLDAV